MEFDAVDTRTGRDGQLHEHRDRFDRTRAVVPLDGGRIVDPLLRPAEQPVDR